MAFILQRGFSPRLHVIEYCSVGLESRYVYLCASAPGRVQDGSYMDAAFVLLAHEGLDKSITSFYPGRLTTASMRLGFV